MESIVFNYIGYMFVFFAAFCVVAPLVVYLISLAVGVVWEVVDEGDSKAPDLLNKVAPFLYSTCKIVKNENMPLRFAIKNREGKYYDISDSKFWTENYSNIKTLDDANNILKSIDPDLSYFIVFKVSVVFSTLGIGFTFAPIITLYLLSSALCLVSLRWSRRGYKKFKKLKVALDAHAKNKDAHK
jgi:hypothetical protein